MKISCIILILLFTKYCSAQHFEYQYDPSGNRIHRIFVYPRLANPAVTNDSLIKHDIYVFPNPTSEKINVSIASLEKDETANVYLSDEQGKILLMNVQTSILDLIDLSHLKAGLYYLKVCIKSECVSYKIERL